MSHIKYRIGSILTRHEKATVFQISVWLNKRPQYIQAWMDDLESLCYVALLDNGFYIAVQA